MIDTKLTDAETAMLEDAGVEVDERPDERDPMLDYATEFADLRATSLTPRHSRGNSASRPSGCGR